MNRTSRLIPRVGAALLLLGLLGLAGMLWLRWSPAQTYPNLLAVSWGDSTYGKALYGAYIYYEPGKSEVRVKATIYIGRPTLWQSYEYGPIDLGAAPNDIEAVARWGQIQWSDEGVRLGSGAHARLIPRAELESHR